MGKHMLPKKAYQAAALLADGMQAVDVAREVGVNKSTIYRWMADDRVRDEYRRVIQASLVPALAKAKKLLISQLDSDAGQGYLAQQAANILLQRYDALIMGEAEQQITVKLEGAPDIGLPPSQDDAHLPPPAEAELEILPPEDTSV